MSEEFTPSDLMDAIHSLREATDHNFDVFRRDVNARFDAVDARFDGVDGRFDRVETRLDGVETRLTSLEGEVRGVKDELRGVKDWTQQVDQRFDAIAQAARVTDA